MHAMIDIETMSTGQNALIMSIGAVAFNPRDTSFIKDGDFAAKPSEFLMGISLNDAMKAGMRADGKTITWWLEQSKEAQESYLNLHHHPLHTVLYHLGAWMKTNKIDYVWSHGSNFDLRILDEAYRLIGQKTPWHYRQEMDTRTLFKMLKELRGCEPTWGTSNRPKHDPLGDAIRQAGAVQDAFRLLYLPLSPMA